MSVPPWTAYDEGYLRAYQWSDALTGGAPLPRESTAMPLGPAEVAHAHFTVGVAGYFGEAKEYNRSFFLIGGPVGLAVTGAASLARNAAKKADAERAAVPRWHSLGTADVMVTNQRLVATANGKAESIPYAETGSLQLAVGSRGVPAVRFQATGHPVLQLESAWSPVLYVFVHHLVDGRPPAVPLPPALLERAKREGRLR